MIVAERTYRIMLQAGCGIVRETRSLLELWEPGLGPAELAKRCLSEGRFPNLAARTLTNLIKEAFAPRYLVDGARPALALKTLMHSIPSADWSQLAFLYTARAVVLLGDFVREIYWPHYAAGANSISLTEAREFVRSVAELGQTDKPWSTSTVDRNGSYLLRTLSDFGLLEATRRPQRKILPYAIRPTVAAVIAYDLHLRGLGDNTIIAHEDWQLFGLQEPDVREELKSLARRDLLIVQSAGDTVRISWRYNSWEELLDALAQS